MATASPFLLTAFPASGSPPTVASSRNSFDSPSTRSTSGKPRMLELLGKLNARIAELNDGSFVVGDRETPRVEAL